MPNNNPKLSLLPPPAPWLPSLASDTEGFAGQSFTPGMVTGGGADASGLPSPDALASSPLLGGLIGGSDSSAPPVGLRGLTAPVGADPSLLRQRPPIYTPPVRSYQMPTAPTYPDLAPPPMMAPPNKGALLGMGLLGILGTIATARNSGPYGGTGGGLMAAIGGFNNGMNQTRQQQYGQAVQSWQAQRQQDLARYGADLKNYQAGTQNVERQRLADARDDNARLRASQIEQRAYDADTNQGNKEQQITDKEAHDADVLRNQFYGKLFSAAPEARQQMLQDAAASGDLDRWGISVPKNADGSYNVAGLETAASVAARNRQQQQQDNAVAGQRQKAITFLSKLDDAGKQHYFGYLDESGEGQRLGIATDKDPNTGKYIVPDLSTTNAAHQKVMETQGAARIQQGETRIGQVDERITLEKQRMEQAQAARAARQTNRDQWKDVVPALRQKARLIDAISKAERDIDTPANQQKITALNQSLAVAEKQIGDYKQAHPDAGAYLDAFTKSHAPAPRTGSTYWLNGSNGNALPAPVQKAVGDVAKDYHLTLDMPDGTGPLQKDGSTIFEIHGANNAHGDPQKAWADQVDPAAIEQFKRRGAVVTQPGGASDPYYRITFPAGKPGTVTAPSASTSAAPMVRPRPTATASVPASRSITYGGTQYKVTVHPKGGN